MAKIEKSELAKKLMGAGFLESDILSSSRHFKEKSPTQLKIPILNLANSGNLEGGLMSGVNIIAGPSRHFKTTLALLEVKAYMDKYEKDGAMCIFYDSEFGVTIDSLIANGVDKDRIIHIHVNSVEDLRNDMKQRLNSIALGDKVIFLVDSIGNLASKKELNDAETGNEAADMTRAKAIKSLFRVVTGTFTDKDIPSIFIAHVYDEQKLYGKQIVSGGTGIMLAANNVWIIGRAQDKDGTELTGYKFTINVEKSRYVKEKSKFEFVVSFDGGIDKWSGLLALALESGHVTKPSNGWYQKGEDTKYREADTHNSAFWLPILSDKTFRDFCKDKYQLAVGQLLKDEE